VEATLTDVGALLAVVLIDLALSADNTVAVGVAAAVLPPEKRPPAIFWGVIIATALRIALGLATVELLHIHGVMALGGVLLLWVSFRMAQDLRAHHAAIDAEPAIEAAKARRSPSLAGAMLAIAGANIALSLDNVLAVAGVARNAPAVMAFGLVLSILLMGVAANWIASVVHANHWIGYVGVFVILFAAATMIWSDVAVLVPGLPSPPAWLAGSAPP
jgi:YjbE family integral membrane protein